MLVRTEEQLESLLKELKENKFIAFDTETTGLSPYTGDRIIGLSFAIPIPNEAPKTWYVPFRHSRGHRLNFHPSVLRRFNEVFGDCNKTFIGWNSKFDCHFLSVDKITIAGTVLDAMLACHLVDENKFSYGLKDVARTVLGKGEVADDSDLTTLLKSEKIDKGAMAELSPIEAAAYAESDASLTWRLFSAYYQKLKQQDLVELFFEVCQYARVLEGAERKGIKIDVDKSEQLIKAATHRDEELLVQLKEMAGSNFNPNSPAQVCKWLNLPSSKREILDDLVDSVPGVAELLEYRGHAKALSSFYLPFRDRRDARGRVHASYKLHGTVSGRLACASPNLQNLPRKSAQWHKVKDTVIAPTGYSLLASDLSQAELRLLAHYTNDPFLINAYVNKLDLHQLVADEVGIDRQAAKTLNFAIVYGAGCEGVGKQLRVEKIIAQKYLDRYHARIPGVKKLYYKLQREAENFGFVTLWSGRRRHFPKLPNGERLKTNTALNSVIQGGVAEIVRVAMTRIDEQMPAGAFQLAQIHDEILVETKNSLLPKVAKLVKYELENVRPFNVPIIAEQKVGKSWAQMEPYVS